MLLLKMGDSSKEDEEVVCPICEKKYPISSIAQHASKCMFLHSTEEVNNHKSPKRGWSFKRKSPLKEEPSPPKRQKVNSEACSSSESNKCNGLDLQFKVPLAAQCQPKHFDEFIGQNQVFGSTAGLRALFEKGNIPNMILWGPPGCGKTSLAGVIENICKNDPKLKFFSLCAATTGVKDVQTVITRAKDQFKLCQKRTVLFMDEIHRFNKKQQDIFLSHVEKGDIILLGATTENPSFSINNALLSRCRVVVFEKLNPENLTQILIKAMAKFKVPVIDEGSNSAATLSIRESALEWLADISDGDARIALNNLQLVLQFSESKKIITIEDISETVKKSHLLYDRKGEEHYNIISAMHKSIRSSDPNAALYWTTRMIVSGEDPLFIARRMVRAASEDIGNADPNALQLAISTMQGCQLLGMPECDVLLAQCAIYVI